MSGLERGPACHALLDSICTIFGDILPGFQAISAGRVVDDAADATLLFDLMQQTDQLLLQFDTALEPLHALIEHLPSCSTGSRRTTFFLTIM